MPTDSQNPAPGPLRRSRNGCRECRRRHRRCDEAKPVCSYCRGVGIACEYSRELSWGGRPFKKSRFGRCVSKDQGLVMVPSEAVSSPVSRDGTSESPQVGRAIDMQFVFSWKPDVPADPAEPSPPTSHPESLESKRRSCHGTSVDWQFEEAASSDSPGTIMGCGILPKPHYLTPETETNVYSKESEYPDVSSFLVSPGMSLRTMVPSSQLSTLSVQHQSLLDYFQHNLCLALSCHDGIRDDLCSALIPMAQNHAHLLAAMLCAAACRRHSIGQERNLDVVTSLRSNAIRLLSKAINGNSGDEPVNLKRPGTIVVALATSLVLCISEIVSSDGTTGGWRVYLSGASALMERLRDIPYSQAGFSVNFLKRLYTSLKAVSVGCGLWMGRLLGEKPAGFCEEGTASGSGETDYIDDFTGFSTALISIFEQIHSMNRGKAAEAVDEYPQLPIHPLPSEDWRTKVIDKVELMLVSRQPRFRSGVASSLTLATKTDFWLLDEAYHHMALLCLRRGYSCDMQSGSSYGHDIEKQSVSIERIIACLSAMDITKKPSPGAAVLPPLFAAGCAATGEADMVRILALLRLVRTSFEMGNVLSAERFLVARWEMLKAGPLPDQGDDMLDFLPY